MSHKLKNKFQLNEPGYKINSFFENILDLRFIKINKPSQFQQVSLQLMAFQNT